MDATPTAERPLAGLRVLDLSRYLPGPLATLRLAELGADVVKLEAPQGDPARLQPPFEPDGTSTLHGYLNRGKRSLVLDLRRRRRPRRRARAGAAERRAGGVVPARHPDPARPRPRRAAGRAPRARDLLDQRVRPGRAAPPAGGPRPHLPGPGRRARPRRAHRRRPAGSARPAGRQRRRPGGGQRDPGGPAAARADRKGAHLDVSLHREAARAIGWERRAVALGLRRRSPAAAC